MKKNWILLLLFSTFLAHVKAQTLSCEEQLLCRVTAPSGLRMRALPDLEANTVTSVPTDSTVLACSNTHGTLTVEGLKGNWRKVSYQNKIGYMYDGYLEVLKIITPERQEIASEKPNIKEANPTLSEVSETTKSPATNLPNRPAKKDKMEIENDYDLLTEIYNYCGDVSQIDPGKVWYGVYPPNQGEKPLSIKKVEVEVVLSKHRKQQNLQFDIKTDQEQGSIFLLGANNATRWEKLNIDNTLPRLQNDQGKLFPGQKLILTQDGQRLLATGGFSINDSCADVSQYKLVSIAGTGQQSLTPLLLDKQSCDIPKLYWYGDLNQDGIPELIFVSKMKNYFEFKLLMSNSENPGQHYREVSTWKSINCP